MAHTDPIADLLTRVRNANQARHPSVDIGYSVVKERVARVMLAEGYLSEVTVAGVVPKRRLQLGLKYTADRRPVVSALRRVSKPGCRVYAGHESIGKIRSGLGISIVSTPRGVMTDEQARQQKVGGEILCEVW